MSFGRRGSAACSSSSRCAMSLWRKICFSHFDCRTPSIIELWLKASDRIRQSGMQLGDGRDAGLVRHVAGGEDQRRFLAVQVGELALELDQRVIGAGDVAGAAGAGAHAGRGLDHGADHLGMLAHAEIVVGAPHDRRRAGPAGECQIARGKPPGQPLEVGENPIAPLVPQAGQGHPRKTRRNSSSGLPGTGAAPFGTLPR